MDISGEDVREGVLERFDSGEEWMESSASGIDNRGLEEVASMMGDRGSGWEKMSSEASLGGSICSGRRLRNDVEGADGQR